MIRPKGSSQWEYLPQSTDDLPSLWKYFPHSDPGRFQQLELFRPGPDSPYSPYHSVPSAPPESSSFHPGPFDKGRPVFDFSEHDPEEVNEQWVRQPTLPAGMMVKQWSYDPDSPLAEFVSPEEDHNPFTSFAGRGEPDIVKEVPVQDLSTEQSGVMMGRLNNYWRNWNQINHSDPDSLPQGYQHPEGVTLHDGNHRATVARHKNEMFLPVRITGESSTAPKDADLEGDRWSSPDHFGRFKP